MAEDLVVAAYLVRGGLRAERAKKCQELSGAYYMYETFEEQLEAAVWLYKDHAAPEQLNMSLEKIRDRATNNKFGYHAVKLQSRIQPDKTRLFLDESSFRVDVTDKAIENGHLGPGLSEDAKLSLLQLLEENAPKALELNWPDGSRVRSDLLSLPPLPIGLESVTIVNMATIFSNKIPDHYDRHHWIHTLKRNLSPLRRLTLINCGISESQMRAFQRHVSGLKIVKKHQCFKTLKDAQREWAYSNSSIAGADLILRYLNLGRSRYKQDIRLIVETLAKRCMAHSCQYSDDELLLRMALVNVASQSNLIDGAIVEQVEWKFRQMDSSLHVDYNIMLDCDVRDLCEEIALEKRREYTFK